MTRPGVARVIGRSIIRSRSRPWADGYQRHTAPAGCPRSPRDGSSGPKAFSRLRVILMRPHSAWAVHRLIFFPIHTAKGFCDSLKSVAKSRAFFIFDEPESALSPSRQIEFLKLPQRMDNSRICQVVMATHSPMLMAYPNAHLLRLSKYGLETVTVQQ